MELQQIKLVNFKNYSEGVFDFHPKLNAIVGMNGMGKTNLMDAIYYLCMGKSYFTASDKNVVRHGEGFIRLDGFVDSKHLEVKVIPGKEKTIIENGSTFDKLTDYIGIHPIVAIAPYDIYHLLALSENRRLFINNTLVQSDGVYLRELMIYNRLLKNRNALLKAFQVDKRQNLVLLETISDQMIKPSAYIIGARKRFIEEISPIFENHYAVISGDREHAALVYDADLRDSSWEQSWKADLQKDLITARTNSGLHKDDLGMLLDGNLVKDFASQGQTKSYVLALKFSQYDHLKAHSNKKPFLLLDDIFDKLDPSRVLHLLNHITQVDFGQVFITDTDEDKVPSMLQKMGMDYKKLHIL